MTKAFIMILVICMSSASLLATQFKDFASKAAEAHSDPAKLRSLIQEYLYRAQNLEDHRSLQNYWVNVDKVACLEHYQRLAKANPDNPDYAYLAIRIKEDNTQDAMKLIARYPRFYWGYRIVAVDFIGKANDEDFSKSTDYVQYLSLIDAGSKEFPEDDYLSLAQAYRHRAENSPEHALSYLSSIRDADVLMSHYYLLYELCKTNGMQDLYQSKVQFIYDYQVASGSISSEESEIYTLSAILDYVADAEGIEDVNKFVQENPRLTDIGETLSMLIDIYLEHDELQQALLYAEKAVSMGTVNFPEMDKSPSYSKLNVYPQWKSLLATAKDIWERDASARTGKLLGTASAKAAPDWELKDIDGNLHKLSDLRDYIVILDFWAQWCGPCKAVMPLLSEWVANEMPHGVKVFSINVMENDLAKAKAYFNQQKYAMTYLEGDDQIAPAYGVRGIPHIVIIDKQGNIVWEQVGSSYDLEEKISLWVEHLSKE